MRSTLPPLSTMAILLLSACGGTSTMAPSAQAQSPTAALPTSTASRVVGVGLDSSGGNEGARLERATNAARSDLASQLQTRVQSNMECRTQTSSTRTATDGVLSTEGASHEICVRNLSAQTSAAMEGVRIIRRDCDASRCRVVVELTVADAVNTLRRLVDDESTAIRTELEASEQASSRGELLAGYARARALLPRAAELDERWAYGRLLDPTFPGLPMSGTEIRDRIDALGRRVRIVVPTGPATGDDSGFWRSLVRALEAEGHRDMIANDPSGAVLELSGAPTFGPPTPLSGAIVVRASVDVTVRPLRPGLADSSVNAVTNGSGPDENAAKNAARVSLACRIAEKLLSELLDEHPRRMTCESWR